MVFFFLTQKSPPYELSTFSFIHMTITVCSPRGHKESEMTEQQASLLAQIVKNLPAMQETLVRSLGWEDPLEKGMATHSSILA